MPNSTIVITIKPISTTIGRMASRRLGSLGVLLAPSSFSRFGPGAEGSATGRSRGLASSHSSDDFLVGTDLVATVVLVTSCVGDQGNDDTEDQRREHKSPHTHLSRHLLEAITAVLRISIHWPSGLSLVGVVALGS
jgi:hypothetical protein